MPLRLISGLLPSPTEEPSRSRADPILPATPSPYARKVRIVLHEKSIPFTLQTEVPWDSTTQTKLHNPLEKLPVLIDTATNTAVYESHFILEWLETYYPDPPMLPPTGSPADRLLAKQVEVVCDGMCDALVLLFFERQREHRSAEWEARQLRKVDGGLRALSAWVGVGKEFIVGDRFGLADVSAGCVLGYMSVRFKERDWKREFENLRVYYEGLERRLSFRETVPVPQVIKDKIV